MWIHITPDLSKVTLGVDGKGVEVDCASFATEYSFVYRPHNVLVTLRVKQQPRYDTWTVRIYDLPEGVWFQTIIVMDDDSNAARPTTQHTLWVHETLSNGGRSQSAS